VLGLLLRSLVEVVPVCLDSDFSIVANNGEIDSITTDRILRY